MNAPHLYRLPRLSVIDVQGEDASTILHNVTTNAVKSLVDGEGCETFITDVRGKTLGHGYLYRQGDRFRFLGAAGQSEAIVQHIDKYTIREDATPTIVDDQYVGLISPQGIMTQTPHDITKQNGVVTPEGSSPACWQHSIGDTEVMLYRTEFLGTETIVALVAAGDLDAVQESLGQQNFEIMTESQFHQSRTLAGFPWYGIDLDEKNLPQEADRDAFAVSFTKGCYLGQETVARLDALGQVQRKLVRWSISGAIPKENATLDTAGKTVGRLTSIAMIHGQETDQSSQTESGIAIGYARRSHFEPGATASGTDSASGDTFIGTVIG